MATIYAADPAVWDGDVGVRIRAELDAGRFVVTRSVSGAVMTIANVDDSGAIEAVAIRNNPYDTFVTDGIPLLIGRVEATSCGLWTTTGYRSSRLVTVHAVDGPDDVAETCGPWKQHLRVLAASAPDPHGWLRQIPAGHPERACPGNHCALRMGPTDRKHLP